MGLAGAWVGLSIKLIYPADFGSKVRSFGQWVAANCAALRCPLLMLVSSPFNIATAAVLVLL